jgi:hypothetical protein
MNSALRSITISGVAVVGMASTILLAGSASACEIVVDSYTGSARCVDAPLPSSATPDPSSLGWLWIGLAVALAITAAVLLARWWTRGRTRPPRPPATKADASTKSPLSEQATPQTPRTA